MESNDTVNASRNRHSKVNRKRTKISNNSELEDNNLSPLPKKRKLNKKKTKQKKKKTPKRISELLKPKDLLAAPPGSKSNVVTYNLEVPSMEHDDVCKECGPLRRSQRTKYGGSDELRQPFRLVPCNGCTIVFHYDCINQRNSNDNPKKLKCKKCMERQ